MPKPISVSVVIPTLGGESLIETIQQLNKGTSIPEEILVCIPIGESCSVENLSFINVKIVRTDCRGQVAQRAEGFKQATCKYVMQLDDDIIVEHHCLEYLVKVLESQKGKCSVSPSLRFIETDKTCYPQKSNMILNKIYYFLINGTNGYKPGTITKAATEIGVDSTHLNSEFIEVDWVPGGCLLHSRENLILNNFYPFSGKAFCEDLYHSFFLKEKSIKLFISKKAIAWIDDPRKQNNLLQFSLKNKLSDYKARRHYLRMASKSLFWMNTYYILVILLGLGRSLKLLDQSNG